MFRFLRPKMALITIIGLTLAVLATSISSQQIIPLSSAPSPHKVFDCFIFNGEDTLLALKLNSMDDYIDYFIIMESQYNQSGSKRNLQFKMTNFLKFSHKIIYLPLRNHPNRKQDFSRKTTDKNKQFTQNSIKQILNVLAQPLDVIILSEIDQIISRTAIDDFKSNSLEYACTEMLLYYEYFNRKSVHYSDSGKQLPNYWYEGARLLTFRYLTNEFKSSAFIAHRSSPCRTEQLIKESSKKHEFVLTNAGWHFAQTDQKYILQQLDKLHTESYLADVQVQKGYFPDALIRDINLHQGLSKYAKYIVGMNIHKLSTKSLIRENKPSTLEKKESNFEENNNRLIIQCFPYNGEEHLLALKLEATKYYVDYYVITEGFYSHTGVSKSLSFNFTRFAKYAHKIIYLPLKNFPVIRENLSVDEKWKNEEFMRNSANQVLDVFARPQDILILSSTDQILSQESFLKFDPKKHQWANTQLRLFYFYFDRRSVYDIDGRIAVPNYLYNGIKITTFGVLRDKYGAGVAHIRRSVGCKYDVSSKMAQDNEGHCQGYLINLAGWHFSYVLDNKHLQQKMRFHANSRSTSYTISNYQKFREGGAAPNAYTKDVSLLHGDLPDELIEDIDNNGEQSQYAPFFANNKFDKPKRSNKQNIVSSVNSKDPQLISDTNDQSIKRGLILSDCCKWFDDLWTIEQVSESAVRLISFAIGLVVSILILLVQHRLKQMKNFGIGQNFKKNQCRYEEKKMEMMEQIVGECMISSDGEAQ